MESSELTSNPISSELIEGSEPEQGGEGTSGAETVETVGQADPEMGAYYEAISGQLDGITLILQFIVLGIFACLGAKLAQGFSFWKW